LLTYSYIEADVAKNRIQELRQQQEIKQMEDLKSKHLSLKLEVEQAHMEEFNGFNQAWDQRMNEFEQKSKEDQEKMENKHQEEFSEMTEQIKTKIPEKPKPSSEILNLKKIQMNLVKQKEYWIFIYFYYFPLVTLKLMLFKLKCSN